MKQIEKPKVLSAEEISKWCKKHGYIKNGICYAANSCEVCKRTIQRDADTEYWQDRIHKQDFIWQQQIEHARDGYVKLAEDQSLPNNPIGDFIPDIGKGQQWAYNKAQQDMLKAGWRKVDTQEAK